MSDRLSVAQVVAVLNNLCRDIGAAKDHFNELDSAAGDGDLGISLFRGFDAVAKGLEGHPDDIGKILIQAGMQFGNSAGSTIGALMSTALMRAGKEAQGLSEVGLPEVARMAQAAEKGIRDRGKAELGKRTLLDALAPAAAALGESAAAGATLVEALERATAAAEEGMIATAAMVPAFGRARWLPERAAGHQDPGAVAIHMMFQSVTESVRELSKD
ncbi:MAG: dihydroxyacetone kinase family protein [Chloroflexota bacterium]